MVAMYYHKQQQPHISHFYYPQAGHETSSNCLVFAVAELAAHPELVEQLHEEVVGVCGDEEVITWEHVHEMRCVVSSL